MMHNISIGLKEDIKELKQSDIYITGWKYLSKDVKALILKKLREE